MPLGPGLQGNVRGSIRCQRNKLVRAAEEDVGDIGEGRVNGQLALRALNRSSHHIIASELQHDAA